ncbi:MAG: TolC family protein [Candidatus Riflebacteria bacterium]|nr:TolC family protein [Candidatus Riflebacteria bacterium]
MKLSTRSIHQSGKNCLFIILFCLVIGVVFGEVATPSAVLSPEDAVQMALTQASVYQQARFNEKIAAEDLKQARAAFLPRVAAPVSVISNSAAHNGETPDQVSFIGANALHDYQGCVTISGEIDIAGRLRATLSRARALLKAAKAGTEAARRAFVEATQEAYFNLALAVAKRQFAEQNLASAKEFEHITQLLFGGREIAEVDLERARLQGRTRVDELEQSRAAEAAAVEGLRVFLGTDSTFPIQVKDLLSCLPNEGEIASFSADSIARHPELARLEAERIAAGQDLRIARADRRPQLSYAVSGGAETDALNQASIKEHTGTLTTVNFSLPIFDGSMTKSKERQARLRLQAAASVQSQTRRELSQQFFTARSQVLSARERILNAQNGLVDAEKNYRVSIARYKAGEAPVLEVTDAQSTLTAQKMALFQAIADYQVGLARLKQGTAP